MNTIIKILSSCLMCWIIINTKIRCSIIELLLFIILLLFLISRNMIRISNNISNIFTLGNSGTLMMEKHFQICFVENLIILSFFFIIINILLLCTLLFLFLCFLDTLNTSHSLKWTNKLRLHSLRISLRWII